MMWYSKKKIGLFSKALFHALLLIIFVCYSFKCGKEEMRGRPVSPANLSHILSLVDSVEIDGETIAFVCVYSDYPDYKPVAAPGEGVSCVDDVGRMLEVLEYEILRYGNDSLVSVARGMTEFLLRMCTSNGLWYNFIYKNGDINKTHQNSMADFGWWAVRGLRGLASAYNIFSHVDCGDAILEKIKLKVLASQSQWRKSLTGYGKYKNTGSGKVPAWLLRDASDMTSELILALVKLYNAGFSGYYDDIRKFSEAIVLTQFRDSHHPLDGMYFCWKNLWHCWGNNQAYALMEAFRIVGDSSYFNSVKSWADNFVRFLIDNNYPSEIKLFADSTYVMRDYPDIAYGVNSIYRGLESLYEVSGEEKYQELAEKVFSWYKGGNVAETKMYDEKTGRCYDGIDENGVNLNSGAESTIECLLSIYKRGYY